MEINNFAQASSKKTINLKFVAVAFSSVACPMSLVSSLTAISQHGKIVVS